MNPLVTGTAKFSLQDVEERAIRLRNHIEKIQLFFVEYFEDKIIEFETRKRYRSVPSQEALKKNLGQFSSAGGNLSSVYFPMMRQDLIVWPICQPMVNSMVDKLPTMYGKIWEDLLRRLMRQQDNQQALNGNDDNFNKPDQPQPIRRQRRRRAKNCRLPDSNTHILKKWLIENWGNPYPTKSEKLAMVKKSGLTLTQINNWFINNRERNMKKFTSRRMKPKRVTRPKEYSSDSDDS